MALNFGEPIEDPELGPNYQLIEQIGYGAYATIFKALHKTSGTMVAVKRQMDIFGDLVGSKKILRELRLLRQLRHPNIAKLLDVRVNESEPKFNSVSLVLELGECDMKEVLESAQHLQPLSVKRAMYDVLLALKYVHSAGVMHRDLKPANLLVFNDESVRLCDFGLARCVEKAYDRSADARDSREDFLLEAPAEGSPCKVNPTFVPLTMASIVSKPSAQSPAEAVNKSVEDEKDDTEQAVSSIKPTKKLTSHVVTRWYRAPEVILREGDYNAGVDMWAVGCIFGELLQGNSLPEHERSPLFPGTSCDPLSPSSRKSEGDQLEVILELLGELSNADCEFISDSRRAESVKQFSQRKECDFENICPTADKDALDLLKQLLAFNPSKRLTVGECLEHSYFDEVRDRKREVVAGEVLQLEFEDEELDEDRLRALFVKELEYYKKARE